MTPVNTIARGLCRLIVDNWLCDHPNDKQAALPTIDTLLSVLGKPPAVNLDTGYFSEVNIAGLQAREIEPYITTGRSPHHQGWHHQRNLGLSPVFAAGLGRCRGRMALVCLAYNLKRLHILQIE